MAAMPVRQTDRQTFRKVIADNFPQWLFSGAKVAELRHRQSGPDPARHLVLDVGYPGSPFRVKMSFATDWEQEIPPSD
jgi:hypothetical protein